MDPRPTSFKRKERAKGPWPLKMPSIVCSEYIGAAARDFQQLDILTSVDSDEPVQPPVKLRNNVQSVAQQS